MLRIADPLGTVLWVFLADALMQGAVTSKVISVLISQRTTQDYAQPSA